MRDFFEKKIKRHLEFKIRLLSLIRKQGYIIIHYIFYIMNNQIKVVMIYMNAELSDQMMNYNCELSDI